MGCSRMSWDIRYYPNLFDGKLAVTYPLAQMYIKNQKKSFGKTHFFIKKFQVFDDFVYIKLSF